MRLIGIITALLFCVLPAKAGVWEGYQIIDYLKVEKLETGRHDFYFRAGFRNTGDAILVPVIVIKGEKPGKRLLLTAAMHGDELNGIDVIHKLLRKIKPEKLSGTIIAVPGINRPGMEIHSRYFPESDGGGSHKNLNRIMPGREFGSAAEQFAYRLWHKLFKPNADMVIDLHTQSRGTEYPLYVFSDFRNRDAKIMAFKLSPDIIKDDIGVKGTLETTFIKHHIPAVTLEIGGPKKFQYGLINRAVSGIMRVMHVYNMYQPTQKLPAYNAPFIGTKTTSVKTHKSGILNLKVKLLDQVRKGQTLGCLYNNFGYKIKCYKAPHQGMVLAVATDPLREAGSLIVRLIK